MHDSVTADPSDQQTSKQYEHGHKPKLARGQLQGDDHAQPAVGYPAHSNANPQSAARYHQQPGQHQGQHHQQPDQRRQQRKRTPETGADHAMHGDPYIQSTTFTHQFTEWNTQPLYIQQGLESGFVDPKMLLRIESDLASTSLYPSYAGSSSHEAYQYQPAAAPYQHPPASFPPPHRPVSSGAGVAASTHAHEYTKSSAIAEEEIAKTRFPPFSNEHIMLIRGFARAADYEKVTAYYGPSGGTPMRHCRVGDCRYYQGRHQDKDCSKCLNGEELVEHYQKRHPKCFLFRCYVRECSLYGQESHGWNTKMAFISHTKPLLETHGKIPHASRYTSQDHVQNPGPRWHDSRKLAESNIENHEAPLTEGGIILIRAYAQAADHDGQLAYYGEHGAFHYHCRESDCLDHEHDGPKCANYFKGQPALTKHYEDKHSEKALFRCYLEYCKDYHKDSHGFTKRNSVVSHIKAEIKKREKQLKEEEEADSQ